MTEPSESPVELARDLIRCPSVTPEDAGALDVLERALAKGGFHCRRLTFSEDGTPPIDNLFARIGSVMARHPVPNLYSRLRNPQRGSDRVGPKAARHP